MPLRALAAAHAVAAARFDKLASSRTMLDKAREQLEGLGKLGDLVSQEDVVKAAGRLVSAGLSPLAMAKLLSDMPEKGEELQAWLQAHVQQLEQREQQLDPVLAQARQDLGTSALRSLTGQELQQMMPGLMPGQEAAPLGPEGPAEAGNNPLMPQQGASQS